MNIAIIGGGSIGLLVSSYLAERHQVTLYVRRNQQRNKVNSQQITLINNELKFQTRNIVAKLSEDFSSHVDLCIVCVKQAQVDEVLIMLASIDKHVPILFLQNGMGHIDKLQAIANPVSVGVVNHGAHKMADDVVHHLGKGTIEIASLTENEYQLKKLIMTLEDKSFPIVYKQSWTSILKEKLIVNAVINPLTALFDVPNGEVVSNNHLNFLAKKICQETAAVLELSFATSWENVKRIAKQTKENVSSMRSDIQKNRETEIEAITGYIIKTSEQPIPYTMFVYQAILALQQERT